MSDSPMAPARLADLKLSLEVFGDEHVKVALLTTHDLKGTDRLVTRTLAAHANDSGDTWPAVDVIADHIGCSDRTVQRALACLVAGRLAARTVPGRAPGSTGSSPPTMVLCSHRYLAR
ncbi:helix-turn-helix domain-containing protein [Micromonospora rosaria]|nr:helix-turn-helix domain-containing protein [Micromonospora rosaria]